MNAANGLRRLLENDAARAKLTRVERAQVRAALAAMEMLHVQAITREMRAAAARHRTRNCHGRAVELEQFAAQLEKVTP